MLALVMMSACGRVDFAPVADATPKCDPMAMFTSIRPIAELNTPTLDGGMRLDDDELTAYYHTRRASARSELWTAHRTSKELPFDPPTLLLTDTVDLYWVSMAPGQLAFVFNDATGIRSATRSAITDPFTAGPAIEALVSLNAQSAPQIRGTSLYYAHDTTNSAIYETNWVPLASGTAVLDTPSDETAPAPAADQLVMYFAHGGAAYDIWVATRPDAQSSFGPGTMVDELNTPTNESPTWLSPDLCRLYFEREQATPADFDVYVAERTP